MRLGDLINGRSEELYSLEKQIVNFSLLSAIDVLEPFKISSFEKKK